MNTQLAKAAKYGVRAKFNRVLDIMSEEFTITRLPEVLQITLANPSQQEPAVCFLFKNGTIVSWNNDAVFTLLEKNKDTIFEPLSQNPVTEEFSYRFDHESFEIIDDVFVVPHDDIKALMSVSYAVAKSLQMEDSEQQVMDVSQRVMSLPTELAVSGRTRMRAKQIKKLIGAIVQLQFTVSTAGLAEDRPDMFWDEPRLAQYYTKTAVHFELEDRWNVLSEKLSALHNTAELMRDEVNTRQSHVLEWIIILLIVFEIVWAFGEKLLS
jgi:uncharacterized Rmd1/YagE family protein